MSWYLGKEMIWYRGGMVVLKNVATYVCCTLRLLRIKVSLEKGESISSDLGILYPMPKILNPNLNFKLRYREILLLAPRNHFILALTWIFLGIGYSQRFFWGILLCFPPLGFTRILLCWGTTSITKRTIFPLFPLNQSPTTYIYQI